MPGGTVLTDATSVGGFLLVLAIVVPVIGILLSFVVRRTICRAVSF